MSWGTVTVGGIAFREERSVDTDGTGKLTIRGQEAMPPKTEAAVLAAHRNVLGLEGSACVPVTFTEKPALNGFYRVDGASSTLTRHENGYPITVAWELSLARLGDDSDVEFESRVPTISRTTELSGVTTSFWHAAPVGYSSYYTGATVPTGSTSRTSTEGAVVAYRGIPNNVTPRWTVAAADYLKGSARLLFDDFRHVGTTTPPYSSWELSNGLVRAASDATGVTVSAWAGSAWESAKSYQFTVGGVALSTAPEATVLRCDPEECTLRLSWATAPGRVTVDLSLRKGSRFVTGVIKRHAAATLGVTRSAAEAATAATGGLRATSADANGNRFVMGSSRTLTTTLPTASIAKAGVTSLDFFLGHEVGASPATGDAFADLLSQYLGTASDRTRLVRR